MIWMMRKKTMMRTLNRNPIGMRLKVANSNAFIVGTPGSRNHTVAKKEILDILLDTDDEILVIDSDGEWVPFARKLGDLGECIEESHVSSNHIDVDIKKRFVVYDIHVLRQNIDLLIVLEHMWKHILENKKKNIRTWLYVDDFITVLKQESAKIFFYDMYRNSSKVGLSITALSKDITTLLHGDYSLEMLANAQFIYLLNQLPENKDRLATVFNMSEKELEYVSEDKDKGCGVIIAQQDIIPFKIILTQQEKKYIFCK